ncbi:MAG: mercuric transport protein periplasmic component [Chromatiales bacterium 21-64-14]|nr:MAG: mercuric transport protein periplasmic component [Chromatiales bacterium 21-64-14]
MTTLAVAVLGPSSVSAAPAATTKPIPLKTITLSVPGMTCGLCPITIRTALEQVPGVAKAKTDFVTRTATVSYDPARTNVAALTKATTDAGYPSTPQP